MKRAFQNFFWQCQGVVAVQIGLLLVVLIGFVALGTDVTFLILKQRQMQATADTAALGGAIAMSTGYPADYTMEARAIATSGGFTDGQADATVVVANPPTTGPNAGNMNAVEVDIQQPQTMSLIAIFRPGPVAVKARAVALVGQESLYCVAALDPSASGAFSIQNNGIVANPNCGVGVNSSSSSGLILQNGAAINGPVSVHGGWSLANNARLNGTPQKQYGPVIDDPYAAVQLQAIPACTSQSGTVTSATKTLASGHFCNGFTFSNNATVTLGSGIYYIDKKLSTSNNVTINATSGVTLVINGNYAMSIGNNAVLNLTAPVTGPYAGLAFFGLRTATASVVQTFSNNTSLKITGAIYFPNQTVDFQNNSVAAKTDCTQIIARRIRISNNVYLDNKCAGTGVQPIGASRAKLTE